MNLINTNYHWKIWVDWIGAKCGKMLQPQKWTFQKEGPEILKRQHFPLSKQRSTILIYKKLVQLQEKISPCWNLEILRIYAWLYMVYMVIWVYMVHISWHKDFIWSLKKHWFLNRNCVLLTRDLAEVLEIFLSWRWGIPVPTKITFCWEKFVTVNKFVTTSWNKINHFTWKHEVCYGNGFYC